MLKWNHFKFISNIKTEWSKILLLWLKIFTLKYHLIPPSDCEKALSEKKLYLFFDLLFKFAFIFGAA
ncbi:unnamed protein product [Blepharisma stoltei]|uniref:Uncharacterized protein n=1 Tax=Blepharisma stoltei TaxID=1481888 RepID=A0AAU9IU08_9CILI|nr:unnamed protein product [Blepharisma stoltei]